MVNNRPSYSGPNKSIQKIIPVNHSSQSRKLKTTENAWKPKNKDKTEYTTKDDEETAEVSVLFWY